MRNPSVPTLRRALACALAILVPALLAACGGGAAELRCDEEDIPDAPAPFCADEGTLVEWADVAECIAGTWEYAALTVRCDDDGLVCRDAACVEPESASGTEPECESDDDCVGMSAPFCEGDTLVVSVAFCDEDAGRCDSARSTVEDCAAAGEVCDAELDACVPAGSGSGTEPECESNDDCVGATPPFCEGDELVADAGRCDLESGTCTSDRVVVEDCAAAGEVCDADLDACVPAGTGSGSGTGSGTPCTGDEECIGMSAPFCDGTAIVVDAARCDVEAGVCVGSRVVVEECADSARGCVEDEGEAACAFEPRACAGDEQCMVADRFCSSDGMAIERVEGTCDLELAVCAFEIVTATVCGPGEGCVDTDEIGPVCADPAEPCPVPCPVLDIGPPTCLDDVSVQLVAIEQDPVTCECIDILDEDDCAEDGRFCVDGEGCVQCTVGTDCAIVGGPFCDGGRVLAPQGVCTTEFTCTSEDVVVDDCAARGETCDEVNAICVANE
ncbi:MAG: hypothetical protein EA398_12765 [Deltaproteobacteria bacterium]|nr:MAG: hypothetical protein EA398_12765 [Deltaproteobacteria bacterium]